jgi:hypothetical protein
MMVVCRWCCPRIPDLAEDPIPAGCEQSDDPQASGRERS